MNDMSGKMHKKAVCLLILCTLVWAALCTSCGCGAPEEDSNMVQTAWVTGSLELAVAESNTKNDTEAAEEPTAEPETDEEIFTEETGGNPGEIHNRYIEITVFEDNYFYENHQMSYEELLSILEELEEGDIVTIYDDNATLNAYQKIISALEEREILYINDANTYIKGSE